MRHAWIFDVLTDLRQYAQKNALPGLAAQVEETLRVARAEITVADGGGPDDTPGPQAKAPPRGRAN